MRESPGGEWEVEITDGKTLVKTLGEPLVVAFCRCFIHADRLNSLTDFGALSVGKHGEGSAAHERNLHTMFWSVAGILHEFQDAIDGLARELKSAGLLTPRLRGWAALQDLHGWSRKKLLRRVRDKLAFHVDEAEIQRGLPRVLRRRKPWLLARGDDDRMRTVQAMLGMDPFLLGLGVSNRDMRSFIRGAARRQLRIPGALQQMFLTVLRRRGLSLRR